MSAKINKVTVKVYGVKMTHKSSVMHYASCDSKKININHKYKCSQKSCFFNWASLCLTFRSNGLLSTHSSHTTSFKRLPTVSNKAVEKK